MFQKAIWAWFFLNVTLPNFDFLALIQYKCTIIVTVVWQHLRKNDQPYVLPLLSSSLGIQQVRKVLWEMWFPVFSHELADICDQILALRTLVDLRFFLFPCKYDTDFKFQNMPIEEMAREPFLFGLSIQTTLDMMIPKCGGRSKKWWLHNKKEGIAAVTVDSFPCRNSCSLLGLTCLWK